jgi:hypothetical protein
MSYIWIGPTIPRLAIRKGMLIKGSAPPPQLKNLMDTKPMLRSLFIPTGKLAEVRTRLMVEGSMEQISVKAVKQFNETKQ